MYRLGFHFEMRWDEMVYLDSGYTAVSDIYILYKFSNCTLLLGYYSITIILHRHSWVHSSIFLNDINQTGFGF